MLSAKEAISLWLLGARKVKKLTNTKMVTTGKTYVAHARSLEKVENYKEEKLHVFLVSGISFFFIHMLFTFDIFTILTTTLSFSFS